MKIKWVNFIPSFMKNHFEERREIPKEEDQRSEKGENNEISSNPNHDETGNTAETTLLSMTDRQVKISLKVDPVYYGRIIGRKGKVIKQLQSDHKVHIQLPKRMENGLANSDLITIQGTPRNIESVKAEIDLIIHLVKSKSSIIN